MIKKLRRRFIRVAMLSFTLVVTVILLATNAVHGYAKLRHCNEMLTLLVSNQGLLPDHPSTAAGWRHNDLLYWQQHEDDETLYELRYFTVTLDEKGQVLHMNTQRTATIKPQDAKGYAEKVWQSGREKGFADCYLYQKVPSSEGWMVMFINCHQQLRDMQDFLLYSLIVCGVGLTLVYILIVLTSRREIQPMVDNYNRQKRFITDASHELKTPLTIISANTEVIEMMEGENEWTRSTRKQINRLSMLVDRMVRLSRLDEAQTALDKAVFSLTHAVEASVNTFSPVMAQAGKPLAASIAENVTYFGNETAIREVIAILLDNAVKYGEEDAPITVCLQGGSHPTLTVENLAPNLTPGSCDQLFERFYRRDASRTQGEKGGFGIGLSMAQSIAAAHRGTLSASSPDGKRIRFTLKL